MLIHIPQPAMQILARRQAESVGSPWVFPGQGRTGHLVEPKGAWQLVLQRAGLKDLRIHDLRRTLGSWQALSGASMLIIGKSLGHTSEASTRVYARLQMDPVRASVDVAAAKILDATGELPTGKRRIEKN